MWVQGKEDLHFGGQASCGGFCEKIEAGMLTFDLGLFNPADCSQVRQFTGGYGVG